ncbi:MAG: hypothetical protein IT320_24515 [Anaerolineae bacterium]|nr:hypothetical protein [Anaerolineae bacterium]
MPDPKRILIFVADLGFGHRSASNAIKQALIDQYGDECTVEIVNPMDSRLTPSFFRNSQEEYDHWVRELPDLYQINYEISDTRMVSSLFESAYVLMLLRAILDLIGRFQPDIIVVTQQTFLAPLDAVFSLRNERMPVVTVVTDLTTIHRMWFHPVSTCCVVPTDRARAEALDAGLTKHQVKEIGIPVNPALALERRKPATIRAELGWREDITTILAVGSKRTRQLPDMLNVLNHSGLPIQLVAIAGGDEDLFKTLERTEWHLPTRIYNYADDMPAMMRAADIVMCKAGGLIVSEALAAGLPILLFDAIEGQETGNADYVVEQGAGVLADDPIRVLETVFHWLQHDGTELRQVAAQSSKAGRPKAAYEIAKLIWKTMA